MKRNNPLLDIVKEHKLDTKKGIFSICSSNDYVLEASMRNVKQYNNYLLIESTSNQVNQYGGYTGMKPVQYVKNIKKLAKKSGFPLERILLGGDHLGPDIWSNEPAEQAVRKSCELVSSYIKAGYFKIHLDASMKCLDDPCDKKLDTRKAAMRAALMCKSGEDTFRTYSSLDCAPCYVIGTEVPIPGGFLSGETEINITTTRSAQETIELTKDAFYELGLEDAWTRVIAIVVQPGVEFGDSSIIKYDREKVKSLSNFINKFGDLVFEAHSTDYQTSKSLIQMVEDHFAILKVGPALTFALREALFALEIIEKEWLYGCEEIIFSNLRKVLDQTMLLNPKYWMKYYKGDANYLHFARKYSYSDRSRYYWSNPKVKKSIKLLINNLSHSSIPENLLSQYLPRQYRKVKNHELENEPMAIISDKINFRLNDYIYACQFN